MAQEKSFLTFGGGCGNNELLTRFKQTIEDGAKKNGYEIYDSFSYQEEAVEDVISNDGKIITAKPGNRVHFEQQMKKVVDKYKNMDCKNDKCQFVLSLSTHGAPGDVSNPENYGIDEEKRGHNICTADNGRYNVSDLKPFLSDLKKLGVNIGIIDESCYGGGSANELQKYGCVLTSTSSYIPHTEPSVFSSYSSAYAKVTNNLKIKAPNMQQMAIAELVNQSSSNQQNVPLIKFPESDKNLAVLNMMTEFIGYRQKSDKLVKGFKYIAKMDVVEFSTVLKQCKAAFDKIVGVIENQKDAQWLKNFLADPKLNSICRETPIVRNHRDKLAEMDWDEENFKTFKSALRCEMASHSSKDQFVKFIGAMNENMITSIKPQLTEFDKGDLDDAFTQASINGKLVKDMAKSYNFKCVSFDFGNKLGKLYEMVRKEASNALKKKDMVTSTRLTNFNFNVQYIIENKAEVNSDPAKCFRYCKTITKFAMSKNFNSELNFLASSCVNKMKALYLMQKEVISSKVKNPKAKNTCEKITL